MGRLMQIVALVVGLGLASGCGVLHRGGPAAAAPKLPATPQSNELRLTKILAVIAESNRGVTMLVIQFADQKQIPVDQAREILDWNKSIAIGVKNALTFASSAASPADKAGALMALINIMQPTTAIDEFLKANVTPGAAGVVTTVRSLSMLVQSLKEFAL